jgi:hypothetical protein
MGIRFGMQIKTKGRCHVNDSFDQLCVFQPRRGIEPPLELVAREMIPRL